VVDNFAPRVIDKLGLGYEVLRSIKPDIIMASTSQLGMNGPPFRGFGTQGAALAGLWSVTGYPDGEPTGLYSAYCDFIANRYLIIAILMALEELSLNLEKTRVVRAEQGFDFLGFRFIRRHSEKHGKRKSHFFPSQDAVRRVKEKVRDRCGNHVLHFGVWDVVRNVNSALRGWWVYYRCSNATRAFGVVQEYVNQRMRRFLRRRRQRPGLGRYRDFTNEFLYEELGLACIVRQGSMRYASRERLRERGRRAV